MRKGRQNADRANRNKEGIRRSFLSGEPFEAESLCFTECRFFASAALHVFRLFRVRSGSVRFSVASLGADALFAERAGVSGPPPDRHSPRRRAAGHLPKPRRRPEPRTLSTLCSTLCSSSGGSSSNSRWR